MSKVTLDSLVRNSVASLQASGHPFNLASVLKNMVVPKDFVVDTDLASDAMLKSYFVNTAGYEVHRLNDELVFAPKGMEQSKIMQTLFPATVTVQPIRRRIFFNISKPTTRGRIRVPVRVMRNLVQSNSPVWMLKDGESVRIYRNRPRTKADKVQKYSTDRYNNLLFLAPNPEKTYNFSVSRGVITAVPLSE